MSDREDGTVECHRAQEEGERAAANAVSLQASKEPGIGAISYMPAERLAMAALDAVDYRGAVDAERDWCQRIIHAEQRGDERVYATLANAAAARLGELGGGSRG